MEMGDDFTIPSFSTLVSKRLRTQLIAKGGVDQLDLTILDSKFEIDKNLGDWIPVVNMLTGLAPRRHKCSIEVQMLMGSSSNRRTFEAIRELRMFYQDVSVEEQSAMVEGCLDDIITQISIAANIRQ
jgi:hypothetical protein